MRLLQKQTSTRHVWTFLRRTRERLAFFAREVPATGTRLFPVIQALVGAEAEMLAADPDLPLRKTVRHKPPPQVEINKVHQLSERVEQLEAAVRAREEQISMMAHDLRGPLSPVLLLVSRLQEQLNTAAPPSVEDLRPRIDGIAHRLHMFVEQLNALLDATRMQTSDLALDPEPVDVVEVAGRIVEEAQQGMFRPPPLSVTGVPSLVGHWDRTRVEQIVRNLVSNALRHGGAQPIEVRIDGSPEGEVAVLSVRDHGIGIAAADHDRIFDKHVRLAKGRGFGLGLWIVRQLVDAMGGTVAVQSQLGDGAEFKVVLPLAR